MEILPLFAGAQFQRIVAAVLSLLMYVRHHRSSSSSNIPGPTMGKGKARHSLNDEEADREHRIQQALQKRRTEHTTYRDLSLEFGIPPSTLCDRFNGLDRQKAHESHQPIHPGIERARGIERLDERDCPPQLDIVKAMIVELARKYAEDELGIQSYVALREPWVRAFMKRHPDIAARFRRQLERQ